MRFPINLPPNSFKNLWRVILIIGNLYHVHKTLTQPLKVAIRLEAGQTTIGEQFWNVMQLYLDNSDSSAMAFAVLGVIEIVRLIYECITNEGARR